MRKPFASFSGQKYEFAKKWAIKIVRPQWLYDSVEKGHCCDAVKYKVEETSGPGEGEGQRTSTPNRGSEGLCEHTFGVYFCSQVVAVDVFGRKKTYIRTTRKKNDDVGIKSSDIF